LRTLIRFIHDHFEHVVDRTVAIARDQAGTAYATTPIDDLRPRIAAALKHIVADLDADPPHHYGDHISAHMERRVREGYGVHDMHAVIHMPECLLSELCRELYPDAEARLVAVERYHLTLGAARRVLFEAFAASTKVVLGEKLDIIEQLSSPVIRIYTGVLLVPLVGLLDAHRSQRILESLLHAVVKERASVVILDLTGVPAIDAGVVHGLTRVTQASRLLGASVVVVGINPVIARTLTQEDVDLAGVVTLADLKAGLELALGLHDLAIQPRKA
jgi:rsbT co-antagonist protein RsbR